MKKVFFGALAIAAFSATMTACGAGEKTDGKNDTVKDTVNAAVKAPVASTTPDSDVVYSVDVENAKETVGPNGNVNVETEVQMTPEGAQ